MIGKHCGQYTRAAGGNRLWFTRQCRVCGRVFAQRKRQPGKKDGERQTQQRLWKERKVSDAAK